MNKTSRRDSSAASISSSAQDDFQQNYENIKVAVRVRPRLEREGNDEEDAVSVLGDNTIILKRSSVRNELSFDRVFAKEATQEDVYDLVSDSIDAVLQGYNATVFAYGQTGTGKTYTMMGIDFSHDTMIDPEFFCDPNHPDYKHELRNRKDLQSLLMRRGIIPRAIEHILDHINRHSNEIHFKLYCSYLEIYKEKIYDLLNYAQNNNGSNNSGLNTTSSNKPTNRTGDLEIREDRIRGIYVQDLTAVLVTRGADIYALMQEGAKNRLMAQTDMNERSSRSHTIFQLFIEQEKIRATADEERVVKRSKLNLVDLAGSEKWKTYSSFNMGDNRIQELTSINQSLSTLGNCISALTQRSRSHIPFRDSKLTRLLQDSLGGNTKTTFVATVSPSVSAFEETCSTLKFADRAKKVVLQTRVNEVMDDAALIKRYEREISRLRVLLKEQHDNISVNMGSSEQLKRLEAENRYLRDENTKLRTALQIVHNRYNNTISAANNSAGPSGASGNDQDDELYRKYNVKSDNKAHEPAEQSIANILPTMRDDRLMDEVKNLLDGCSTTIFNKSQHSADPLLVLTQENANIKDTNILLKEKLRLMEKSVIMQVQELERTKKLFVRDIKQLQRELDAKKKEVEEARAKEQALKQIFQNLEHMILKEAGNQDQKQDSGTKGSSSSTTTSNHKNAYYNTINMFFTNPDEFLRQLTGGKPASTIFCQHCHQHNATTHNGATILSNVTDKAIQIEEINVKPSTTTTASTSTDSRLKQHQQSSRSDILTESDKEAEHFKRILKEITSTEENEAKAHWTSTVVQQTMEMRDSQSQMFVTLMSLRNALVRVLERIKHLEDKAKQNKKSGSNISSSNNNEINVEAEISLSYCRQYVETILDTVLNVHIQQLQKRSFLSTMAISSMMDDLAPIAPRTQQQIEDVVCHLGARQSYLATSREPTLPPEIMAIVDQEIQEEITRYEYEQQKQQQQQQQQQQPVEDTTSRATEPEPATTERLPTRPMAVAEIATAEATDDSAKMPLTTTPSNKHPEPPHVKMVTVREASSSDGNSISNNNNRNNTAEVNQTPNTTKDCEVVAAMMPGPGSTVALSDVASIPPTPEPKQHEHERLLDEHSGALSTPSMVPPSPPSPSPTSVRIDHHHHHHSTEENDSSRTLSPRMDAEPTTTTTTTTISPSTIHMETNDPDSSYYLNFPVSSPRLMELINSHSFNNTKLSLDGSDGANFDGGGGGGDGTSSSSATYANEEEEAVSILRRIESIQSIRQARSRSNSITSPSSASISSTTPTTTTTTTTTVSPLQHAAQSLSSSSPVTMIGGESSTHHDDEYAEQKQQHHNDDNVSDAEEVVDYKLHHHHHHENPEDTEDIEGEEDFERLLRSQVAMIHNHNNNNNNIDDNDHGTDSDSDSDIATINAASAAVGEEEEDPDEEEELEREHFVSSEARPESKFVSILGSINVTASNNSSSKLPKRAMFSNPHMLYSANKGCGNTAAHNNNNNDDDDDDDDGNK